MHEIFIPKNGLKIGDLKTADGKYVVPDFQTAFQVLAVIGKYVYTRACKFDPLAQEIYNTYILYRRGQSHHLPKLLKDIGQFLDLMDAEDNSLLN